MIVLGYVFIIKVGDPKIKYDGKNERKIKDREINAIAGCPYFILNSPVETQNKNGFYEQIHDQ